ncbi:homocitrate synthase [Candidatus Protofrankia californiensis]|uniref:Homocitrate synthase n=2 Tax=Protofrankia TaxID=2994361 RepID=A0A1C3P4Q3_9ACTN|nr:homocitrate synthase [Candidatus Protofrankia californiensis]
MALRHLLGFRVDLDTTSFRALADLVSRAAGRPVSAGKAIVGESAFIHESGIHVDGVLKAPRIYEPFDPAEVGARRRLVVGKHAGRASLRYALREHGIDADEGVLGPVLEGLRSHVSMLKRPLRSSEVRDLYELAAASWAAGAST